MLQFNATFIIALISFVIFIILMNYIFYKPVLCILEKRKQYIDNNISASDTMKNEAEKILKEKDNRINDANSLSKNILNEKTTVAASKAKEIINTAKSLSTEKIQTQKDNLKNYENNADIDTSADDISDVIVGKILGGA